MMNTAELYQISGLCLDQRISCHLLSMSTGVNPVAAHDCQSPIQQVIKYVVHTESVYTSALCILLKMLHVTYIYMDGHIDACIYILACIFIGIKCTYYNVYNLIYDCICVCIVYTYTCMYIYIWLYMCVYIHIGFFKQPSMDTGCLAVLAIKVFGCSSASSITKISLSSLK